MFAKTPWTQHQTHVVSAARMLVGKRGYALVSLRGIAAAAGYSPAGLYAHFPSREAILEALISQIRAELRAALERAVATATDPLRQLVALGCAYVSFAVAGPAEFELLFRQTRSRRRSRTDPIPSPFDLLRTVARRVRPRASEDQIDLAALGLWSAAHGLASLRTSHLADFTGDWETWTRQVIQAQVEGALCVTR
jgi:AcrR family transcriptional regulator